MKNSFKSKLEIVQKGLACRQAGFTLIELLIVIAVLGILATAVLVAINPIEQINRSRDAGRISSVSQLGQAMQTYYTGQGLTLYPVNSVAWETPLLTANELKFLVTSLPVATAGTCPAANMHTGTNICYARLTLVTAGDDATIWTILDSSSNKVKAGGCAAAGNVAAAVWIASQGKTGVACLTNMGTVPVSAQALN